jgi:transposase
VHQVKLAWARPGSGFTLLFEALTMALCAQMPVRAVADLIGEHDTRVWRIVHHYVDKAVAAQDLSEVERVGLDDTSFRRGQSYVTLFADLDERRCVFATPGRDAATVERFAQDLRAHGGHPDQVTEVCQDMSEPYLIGVLEQLQEAEITFDRYHIKAQLNKVVDQVRIAERQEHRDTLKRSRYLWLRRPENLSKKQRARLDVLLELPLETARAYNWALRFEQVYDLTGEEAGAYLRHWIDGVQRSAIAPLIDFAAMVEDHWPGVLRWFESRISNGLLEGLNSLVQSAKRRARGYRSTRNYIAMIYLTVGKLNMALPT